jgi:hypothetical protein
MLIHQAQLDVDEWMIVDGLPVTTPIRTLRDLAAARTDGGHLADAVRDALAAGLVDRGELADTLRPFAHWYGAPSGDGVALLQRLLSESDPGDAVPDMATLPERRRDLPPVLADLARFISSPEGERLLRTVREVDPKVLRQLETLSRQVAPRQLEELRRLAAEAGRRGRGHRG